MVKINISYKACLGFYDIKNERGRLHFLLTMGIIFAMGLFLNWIPFILGISILVITIFQSINIKKTKEGEK